MARDLEEMLRLRQDQLRSIHDEENWIDRLRYWWDDFDGSAFFFYVVGIPNLIMLVMIELWVLWVMAIEIFFQ